MSFRKYVLKFLGSRIPEFCSDRFSNFSSVLNRLACLKYKRFSRHFKFFQTLFHTGGTLFPSEVSPTNSTKKVPGGISSIERNAYILNSELFWLNSAD